MNVFITMSFVLLLSFPAMCVAIAFGFSENVKPFYEAALGLWFLSIVLVVLKHKAK